MGSRKMLVAFNRQVRQLPADLAERECALLELGRQYARNLDAGHSPSGQGLRQVLAELRRLAKAEQPAPEQPDMSAAPSKGTSGIADLTARIAARRDTTPG